VKGVSVMIIVDAPDKAELIPKLIIRFEDASEVLCVEKTRTRRETLTWSIPCNTTVVNRGFLWRKLHSTKERIHRYRAVARLLTGMLHPNKRS
jgi:hypothetical protein